MSINSPNRNFSPSGLLVFDGIQDIIGKDPSFFNFLISKVQFEYKAVPFLNKFGWQALITNIKEFNVTKLSLFHFILTNYDYLKCDYKDFEILFIGEKAIPKKVIWYGNINILVLLFLEMQNKEFFSTNTKIYDCLCDSFLYKTKVKGKLIIKKLSKGSLGSTKSRGVNSDIKEIVDTIVRFMTC